MAENMIAYRRRPEDVFEEPPEDNRDVYTHQQAFEILTDAEAEREKNLRRQLNWGEDVRRFYNLWWSQINLISGIRGAGKSLLAAFVAWYFYLRGHQVFSNIGLRFGHILEGPSIYGLARLDRNSVIVLDEAHTIFDKWAQMTARQRLATGGLANFRKRMLSLILPSSQESNFGINLMSELAYIWYPMQKKPVRSKHGLYTGSNDNRRSFISQDWANIRVDYVGPRPVRGKFVGEEYGIKVGGPKPKRRLWLPPAVQLEQIGATYSSYTDIPTRAQSGTTVSAKDLAGMNVDSDIIIIDIDGNTPEGQLEINRQNFVDIFNDLMVGSFDLPYPKNDLYISYDAAYHRYANVAENPDRSEFERMCTEYLNGDGQQFLIQDFIDTSPNLTKEMITP